MRWLLIGVALTVACRPLQVPPRAAGHPQRPATIQQQATDASAAAARLDELPSSEPAKGDLLEPWGPSESPSDAELLAMRVQDPSVPRPQPAGPSQVALWRGGQQVRLMEHAEARDAGLMVLDLGTEWVPDLFRSVEGYPHAYQTDFADLANGRFHDDAQGRRAQRDRYLELYGIPPSPAVLARRFAKLDLAPCTRMVPAPALGGFEGVPWGERQQDEPEVDPEVVKALQSRLVCESHYRGRPTGGLDLRTRYALEEFERRNRIYARGSLQGETLKALQTEPLELERQALVRTLTERLVLDLGVIEDRSARGLFPRGSMADARERRGKAPNVVARIERAIVRGLGLGDVVTTRVFYRSLGEVLSREHYYIALLPVSLPDYHSDDMELFVEIDRGDIYYDFPYDDEGTRRTQPRQNLPTLTLFARVRSKRRGGRARIVPLANYGTTIGGWRVQRFRDEDLWTYKESPVGSRVWSRIVSAPVWLPPAKTPPETLIYQARTSEEGEPVWELNENLVGPGYASAYGLVAAYHQKFVERKGRRVPTHDEGIRSHGSSDYTSIWQRASLGCHRLHNHLAIRLFNFILAHRPHRRMGHRSARFRMPVSRQDFETVIEVDRTGYAFALREPIFVEVLPGSVLGDRKRPPRYRIPVEAK